MVSSMPRAFNIDLFVPTPGRGDTKGMMKPAIDAVTLLEKVGCKPGVHYRLQRDPVRRADDLCWQFSFADRDKAMLFKLVCLGVRNG